MWVELDEPVVAYFPTSVPISFLLFLLPRYAHLQARNGAINLPFLLSGYFMLPEVHHGEQQEQEEEVLLS